MTETPPPLPLRYLIGVEAGVISLDDAEARWAVEVAAGVEPGPLA